jgi:hypothetical protein
VLSRKEVGAKLCLREKLGLAHDHLRGVLIQVYGFRYVDEGYDRQSKHQVSRRNGRVSIKKNSAVNVKKYFSLDHKLHHHLISKGRRSGISKLSSLTFPACFR